jgi:uncharacterized protein (UPF0548 family)
VFRFSKPTAAQIEAAIREAASLPSKSSGWFESTGRLRERRIPFGYAHDFASLRIGSGETVFAAARSAFARWKQFDLCWVRVTDSEAALALGQIVAVEVHTLGLWSLNLSQIVQMIDTPTQFGFVYATTPLHVEHGEERFLLDFNPQTGSATYLLEAISRPRNIFAKLGYPFTRAMQHRFARESLTHMFNVIQGGNAANEIQKLIP